MTVSASDSLLPDGGAPPAPAAPVVSLEGISKSYPGVVALRDIFFQVQAGEVRGLVGENGAGKSSLIKTIAGAIAPDTGTIEVGGRRLRRLTPTLAASLGIAVIHQERQVSGDISVAENILLGRLPVRRTGIVDWNAAYRQAKRVADVVGLSVDVRRPAGELGVAEQQEVEIARALVGKSNLVIMDEPTASLGRGEVARLFDVVRRLRADGRAVLYISHHLEEIFEIADTVTVMRDGEIVRTAPVSTFDSRQLTTLMFGRDVDDEIVAAGRPQSASAPVALAARGLRVGTALRSVDFHARRGEIVCVSGGIGSGRRELARCLACVEQPDGGIVEVAAGARMVAPRGPRSALKHGIGFIPDDRKREGVLLDLDLVENIDVTRLSLANTPAFSVARRRKRAEAYMERLKIAASSAKQRAGDLSGGNQQKALIARLLSVDATVLILDEPTAGIDVNTKLEIYELLRGLAARGSAIVVFSSDYQEIEMLAHRVVVLVRGAVVADLRARDASKERLLLLESEAS